VSRTDNLLVSGEKKKSRMEWNTKVAETQGKKGHMAGMKKLER